ncbi:MAG: desulfoferrodoxin [Methanoregula sp.]|jgi:superoxide reductase|nr:desulfoferrodoxin [Methanoregula sp.]
MTKMLEVYKCGVCGNTTMVVSPSGGTLVCCGQPMTLQPEKTDDTGKEKHVPVVEKTANGIKVKLGSIPHPMEEKHYIQWVEVISGDDLFVRGLKPGQKPEAEFPVLGSRMKVRAYCNVHGLWTDRA